MNIGQKILQILKEEITEVEFNRYIKNLTYDTNLSSQSKAIYYANNVLVSKWVTSKYRVKLEHLFEVNTNLKVDVSISMKSKKEVKKVIAKKIEIRNSTNSLLNPSLTFENFMVGASNQFAYSAIKSVSEKPGNLYNPLFLYGGVGLGKTHLMQSAGNYYLTKGKNVIFTTSEQLLNDFTRHIRNKTMEKFKDNYRKCDVLLVDDIQFLGGKDGVQEEFFHTFEALKGEGKQIILTADKRPKDIVGFTDRLVSRFEWGLVADIQPPELKTKIAIIEKKCEINDVKLSKEIVNYIATVMDSNVREIEGILSKLHAYSTMIGVDIDLEFTKSVLKEQKNVVSMEISIDSITQLVAKELNIKISDIRSKSRVRKIIYARRVAIYSARTILESKMPELAKYFGMKDHTAISHNMKKIKSLIKEDIDFRLKIDEIKNKITTN